MAIGIIATSALLLSAAFSNQYPLVHSDTVTYVHSSFTWRVPPDRPVFYGLFLAATHAGRTLWAPVAAQAVIVAVSLALLMRVVVPGSGPMATVVVAAGLTFATSLPWFVGQLSPDVFAGLCVVSFYLLLAGGERLGPAGRTFAFTCLAVSAMVHTSHLLLGTILAGVMQLAPPRARPREGLRGAWKALGLAVVAILLGNVILSGKPVIARGAHAFLLGRLIEDGVVARVLDERCTKIPYRLCAFRAELPVSADDYLWKPNSLLQRTGGWHGSKSESWQLILAAAVAHPLVMVEGGLVSSARQLVRFRTGDGLGPPEGDSWVDRVIAERLPDEVPLYRSAHQHQGTLSIAGLATFHQCAAIAAVLLLTSAALTRRWAEPRPWRSFAAFLALALVVNAVVTGGLSGPHDRYQSRLIWLVVLTALAAVADTRSCR